MILFEIRMIATFRDARYDIHIKCLWGRHENYTRITGSQKNGKILVLDTVNEQGCVKLKKKTEKLMNSVVKVPIKKRRRIGY